ncbi:MAG: ABC transporter permease [Anaerolineae bacterium]
MAYLVQRVVALVPVLLVVGAVAFLIVHFIPGNPAAVMLGPEATPEDIQRLTTQLGLDQPLAVQFVRWMWNAVRGDFGESIFVKRPVPEAIAARIEPSLLLATMSQLLSLLVAIPAGMTAALRRGTLIDRLLMGFSVGGLSIPSFWLGLLLILLFSVRLRWLPVAGYVPLAEGWKDTLRYLVLPASTLALVNAALISRMTRAAVLDVIRQDYVRTARAKGLPERVVILRHVLRSALVPLITVIGLSFGGLFSGAIIVESVFGIPGLGQMVWGAVFQRDYPVIQGVLVFIALIYVIINLLVDLAYVWADPRVRF